MDFKSLIKSEKKPEEAFDDLQADMAEAFEQSLRIDDQLPPTDNISSDQESAAIESHPRPDELAPVDLPTMSEAQPDLAPATQRMTSHAQGRLATLSSFDRLYQDAQEHLQEVDAKLTEVRTSHHLTRELFNILHSDIYRANELELANSSLVAEQAGLSEQLRDANRKQQEAESVVSALQQRETGLAHDKESLRNALAAAKLETVEAANTIARNEAQLGELVKTLTAKTIECDRRSHENEALRVKHLNLSIEFDKAMNREAETRRQLDELSNIHANEAVRNSELLLTLGNREKELVRLQMSLEAAQAKQSELAEEARIFEAERQAAAARSLDEVRDLRSEIQGLQSRLEHASDEHREASNEIDMLNARSRDALAEKVIADERMSALVREREIDKKNLATANANFSQLSLDQASDQMQLDIQRQECEDLRVEIASLNARVEDLLPYERLFRVTKAKQHSAEEVADVAGLAEVTSVPPDTTHPESGHAPTPVRRGRANPGFHR